MDLQSEEISADGEICSYYTCERATDICSQKLCIRNKSQTKIVIHVCGMHLPLLKNLNAQLKIVSNTINRYSDLEVRNRWNYEQVNGMTSLDVMVIYSLLLAAWTPMREINSSLKLHMVPEEVKQGKQRLLENLELMKKIAKEKTEKRKYEKLCKKRKMNLDRFCISD